MGMTDEQFNSYKSLLLRELERVLEEYAEKGNSKTLKEMIETFKAELKKP